MSSKAPQWLALCHNDVQQGNIMERSEKPLVASSRCLGHRDMCLIDFEYSGFNPVA